MIGPKKYLAEEIELIGEGLKKPDGITIMH